MHDRQPTKPGRVLITPEDGTAPFYAVLARADEPTDPGTPYNKATQLTDETSALLGGAETVNEALAALFNESVKMEIGTYAGTGTSGAGSPKKLTFSFKPDLVIISRNPLSYYFYMSQILIRDLSEINGYQQATSSSLYTVHYTWTDNGVEWYSNNQNYQLNATGSEYVYVAIGRKETP